MPSHVAWYQGHRNPTEHLVVEHMPMVKRVAVHLKPRLPPFMELEELIQVGMVGLIEAAQAFDTSKGEEFERFALARVRGAMVDEVRRLSSMPRSAVAFHRQEAEATRALATELGRAPRSSEVARHLGMELEEFHKERDAASRFETHSMEVLEQEAMGIADDALRQPQAIVEMEECIGVLGSAIGELSERERLVLNLYYVEELNLKEIGEVLEVSESRVSQILSATVKRLRATIGGS